MEVSVHQCVCFPASCSIEHMPTVSAGFLLKLLTYIKSLNQTKKTSKS